MAELGEKKVPVYTSENASSMDEPKYANAGERRASLANDEAADIYGNSGSAAEYGYVERA
jgi:hypothetical protein